MSVPIIYANTQYIAGKHIFKTIPTDINLSLTSLANVPTCNVMTIINANVGIGTTNPLNSLHVQNQSYFVGNVGIGTTNPRQLLDIQGGDAIISGNVGIGTTNPLYKLHVNGSAQVDGTLHVENAAHVNEIQADDGSATDPSFTFLSDTNTGMYIAAADTLAFSTNGTERVRVSSSGNVGIGTTNPLYKLHVNGTLFVAGVADVDEIQADDGSATDPSFTFRSDKNTGMYIAAPNTLAFSTNGSERVRVIAGNVGIGTTNPLYKLHVNGSAYVDSTLYVAGVADVDEIQADDGSATDPSFTFRSDTNTGMYIAAADTLAFSTDGNERVRVSSSGSVGIGTTNPLYKLHVNGSAYVDSTLYVAGTGDVDEIQADDGSVTDPSFTFRSDTNTGMYRQAADTLAFSTNGTECARFTSSQALRLYGNLKMYNGATEGGEISTDGSDLYIEATDDIKSLTLYNNTTFSGGIYPVYIDSTNTLFRNSSSLRYKKDIVTIEDSIADRILNCRPISYKLIDTRETPNDMTQFGFIAEEVVLIEPRLVAYNKNNEPESIYYDRFIPLLLNIIKRQKNEINTLRTDYNNLVQILQSKGILP